MRHVIRDEILNFSFFGLNYHKRAKMCGSLIMHESIVYESLKKKYCGILLENHLLCVHLWDEHAAKAINVWIVNL